MSPVLLVGAKMSREHGDHLDLQEYAVAQIYLEAV
jgi:hypothetical protein